MAARKVNLLHVEDNLVQRALLAGLLETLPELELTITVAESEDEAVAEFVRGGIDFVLLDYQLSQGDGLQCLLRIRQRDPLVPVVAISGTATAEIAADLIRGGADDYLNKLDLTREKLATSVREALRRADLFRRRLPATDADGAGQADSVLPALWDSFLGGPGPALLESLDAFERAARQARLSPEALRCQFECVCQAWDAVPGRPQARRVLRPLMLELFLRLYGSKADTGTGVPIPGR
jgi:CheY-like chemotaxis protein